MRTENAFHTFWEYVERSTQVNGVQAAQLPRQRKAPRRFEVGTTEGVHPESPEQYYKPIYFEALDSIVTAIEECFN